MYMINHSLNYKFLGSSDVIVPDRAKAATTNSVASQVASSSLDIHFTKTLPLSLVLWRTLTAAHRWGRTFGLHLYSLTG